MKCPLCNNPLNYDPHDGTHECCNMDCSACVFGPTGTIFWNDLRIQIADIRAKAVKRAFQQRRCKTCGLFPAGKCQYALVAHPNFGCIYWTKKGAK